MHTHEHVHIQVYLCVKSKEHPPEGRETPGTDKIEKSPAFTGHQLCYPFSQCVVTCCLHYWKKKGLLFIIRKHFGENINNFLK